MKSNFPHVALARLCGWFGLTRQAYYQNNWEGISTGIEEELIIQKVLQIRKNHCRMGTRKLYELMQVYMEEHSIKMGRDALFNLLAANNLLVRRRKRRIQTTNSNHWLRKYPNLIREIVLTGANQLWVSDITYWKIKTGEHLYISFITDAWSHKIVGFQVADTMEAIESIEALKMAIRGLGKEKEIKLIHHSDRGSQYCSAEYVKLLKDNQIGISMTENGDPRENAIAERLNGIIKEEYIDNYDVNSLKEAKQLLKSVVDLYNDERPHMSIGNQTPTKIHHSKTKEKPEKLWKNYYQQKPTFVKQDQDETSTVNSYQD
jgi:transposase InsO family protein